MNRYYPEIYGHFSANYSSRVVNKDGTLTMFRTLGNSCNSYQEAVERIYKYFPLSHNRVIEIEDSLSESIQSQN